MSYMRLNTNRLIKQFFGIDDSVLSELKLDPAHDYVEAPCVRTEVGKGEVVYFTLPELNIKKGAAVVVEVNPELLELGHFSHNAILPSGPYQPSIRFKAESKVVVDLDWIARLRVID